MSEQREQAPFARDYQQSLVVSCAPNAAMNAVADQVTQWWSDVVAGNGAAGQSFVVVFGSTAKLLKVRERKEGELLVWECRDVLMPDPTSDYPNEWRGTRMIWQFTPDGDGTKITLTHEGLTPQLHCFETCNTAWDFFVLDSLKTYLETGKGDPHMNHP